MIQNFLLVFYCHLIAGKYRFAIDMPDLECRFARFFRIRTDCPRRHFFDILSQCKQCRRTRKTVFPNASTLSANAITGKSKYATTLTKSHALSSLKNCASSINTIEIGFPASRASCWHALILRYSHPLFGVCQLKSALRLIRPSSRRLMI